MQLAEERTNIIRSKDFVESKFKIQASAKAFQILSSGLYSDKYIAIVRELSTNASDAHVAAGIPDKPIIVHVPDYMDGDFFVRDFGNGIDPEEFETIYTTYFSSTKTNTNDETGCFGLGSKSPYAYTKQFTVENNHKGVKYIYTCFINEVGEPSISLLGQSETEDRGIKVSFSVKRDDMYAFESAARTVLQWFKVTPECNTVIINKTFPEKYKILDLHRGYYVLMGQVAYPISDSNKEPYFSRGCFINANIGDVDITPSRESLEYTKRTISFLKKVNEELKNEIDERVKEIMNDSSKSQFGKFKALHAFCDDNFPEFREEVINNNFKNNNNYCKVFAMVDQNKYPNITNVNITGWKKNKLEFSNYTISISSEKTILIKDKSSKINKKMEHYLNNNGNCGIILVPQEDKDAFIAEYGMCEDDLVYASKYELPSFYSTTTTSNNCCVLYKKYGNFEKKSTKITKDDKDGYYITEKYFSECLKYSTISTKFGNYWINQGEPKLYIFTEHQFNNLKINKRNFKNFLDILVDKLKSERKNAVDALSADIINSSNSHRRSIEIGKLSKTNSLFKQYYDFHSSLKYDSNDSVAYENFFDIIRLHDPDFYAEVEKEVLDKVSQYSSLVEQAKEKYPLTKILLDNKEFDGIINSVVDYVDMIENKE